MEPPSGVNSTTTHELAADAGFEAYSLLEMLLREGEHLEETWFPYLLRSTVQRLMKLNEVQMKMCDDTEPPLLAEMKALMFDSFARQRSL